MGLGDKMKSVILVMNILLIVDTKLIAPKHDENQLLVDVPIENKSWFEAQVFGSGKTIENQGDVMVFDGGTWTPFNICQNCGKFQNYQSKCHHNEEYLNLCGECVGGKSEKEDDFGLDSCGICRGIERCGQTPCDDGIEELEPATNCTRVIGLRPKVLDMATSPKGTIYLIGNIDRQNVICSMSSGAAEVGKVDVKETEIGLEFSFDLPKKEGKMELICNTSEGVLTNQVLAADTKKLQPMFTEQIIAFGTQSKVTVTVGNMYALADLLCFAKDDTGVIYKAWSGDIQGNSLSSKVVCDRIWPKKAGAMKLGVAYSEQAINQAKTLDITVNTKPLTLLKASLSKNKLTLYFDQTIGTYSNCNTIFRDISNSAAKCWSVGNEIRVNFKGTPKFKAGDTLVVKAASAATGVVESFSIKIDSLQVSESLSNLEIKGPETVCSGQQVSFDIDGSAVKWSLTVPNISSSVGVVTPGNQQRRNLILWNGLRETRKTLKNDISDNRVTLNTTLLTSGVEYQVKAYLPNGNGQASTFTKNFMVVTDNAGKPIIKGPSRIGWTNDALYEIDNNMCDSRIANFKYEWAIDDKKQSVIQQTGSKMHLKGGMLESNTKYNLSVRLFNNTEMISEAAMELITQPAQLKAATYVEQIVYGTGHRIILSGNSEIIPSKSASIKYQWSCESESGPCLMPGREKKMVDTLEGFDSSVLVLPPGSLPVGKYDFTLNVTLSSGESTSKTTQVLIIPGEPTLLSLDSIDFEQNMKILMQAKDIIGECEIYLESLPSLNTSYIDISDMMKPLKIKGTPHDPLSKTVLLNVPFEKLVYGASYLFRLSADCGAFSQTWMMFTVPVPEKSASCELAVTPNTGVALSTKFTFKASDCYTSNAIYSYGYYYNEKIHYIISTLEPQQSILSLPGIVKPVMKVCEPDKMCALYFAESMNVEEPLSIDNQIIRLQLDEYLDNLNSGHFEDVLGVAVLLMESSQHLPNVRKNISDSLIQILISRIKTVADGLDENGRVTPDVLNLLQCAMGIIKTADASNDEITTILEFRNKIEDKVKQSNNIRQFNSLGIKEPRWKRSTATNDVSLGGQTTIVDQVKTFLDTYSTIIKMYPAPESIRNETDRLLKNISNYVVDLCNDLKDMKPHYIESDLVEISAVRVETNKIKVDNNFPDCLDKCKNWTGQVILTKPFLDQFNKSVVCLGLNYFQNDVYTTTSNASSEWNITRLSGVYTSMLYNYTGKIAVENNKGLYRQMLGTIRIPIWNFTHAKNSSLKCHAWNDETGWNFNLCRTKKIIQLHSVQALECQCPFPGIYAVFALPKTSILPPVVPVPPKVTPTVKSTTPAPTTVAITSTPKPATVTTPSTTVQTTVTTKAAVTNATAAPTTKETIPTTKLPSTTTTVAPTLKPEEYKVAASFVIQENYNETVGTKNDEFASSLKTQLKKTVHIPDQTKVEAVDNHENIKVIVRMRYGDKSDMPLLNKLLNEGELRLLGLNNQTLKVPNQNLELSLAPKEGKSSTLAVITSAMFISFAFIIAILLSGMFLKWKRQQRALSFVQNMEISAPKYLRLQETSSIDRIERSYSSENLRSGDLDSGIVLTVDPNRMSTKYRPRDSSSNSRHTVT